ncbi:MAG: response regulator transcription factor [Kosmotoga sp.]|nr:MAG: response regulator transcription factor [Kosmotoga sp.]
MKTRILIIEDDPHISKFLELELQHEGYEVQHVSSGQTALEEISEQLPDLVILDIMIPELDGYQVLKMIREDYSSELPVIMLTAKREVKDKVKGLKTGADDYLTKPFHIEELIARIEAQLRRIKGPEKLVYREVVLNRSSREVRVSDEVIKLSKTEFDLLDLLMENKGIVVSRSKILDRVWGTEDWSNENVVEVYINYLRKKLKDAGKYINTVRGVGYVFK